MNYTSLSIFWILSSIFGPKVHLNVLIGFLHINQLSSSSILRPNAIQSAEQIGEKRHPTNLSRLFGNKNA